MGENKGLDYFIKLAKLVNEDEIIVMVGLKEKQIKELPINIIGIPRTNSAKELAEIYSIADVFINPTLQEVLGLVNIEALACGTPVITFDTGGSPECIDESCGFVVEKDNLEALVDSMYIVKNKSKLSYYENCKQRAIKFYNFKDRFNDYVELYKEITV